MNCSMYNIAPWNKNLQYKFVRRSESRYWKNNLRYLATLQVTKGIVSWLVPHSPKWCPAYLTLPGNKIYLGDSSANLEDMLLPLDQVLFHVRFYICSWNEMLQISYFSAIFELVF